MYVYSGYGLTFDGATFQSFDNDTHRDLMDFAVDNSSSYHTEQFYNIRRSPVFHFA